MPSRHQCEQSGPAAGPRRIAGRGVLLLLAFSAVALLLCACGSADNTLKQDTPANPGSALARKVGSFSLQAVDADGAPLPWPQNLSVTASESGAGTKLALEAQGFAPDDLYVTLEYDSAQWSYSELQLDPARAREYISLAVGNQEPGVLHFGLARIGSFRGVPAAPGPLLTISFVPGPDSVSHGTSVVNKDPQSAPQLEVDSSTQTSAVLGFDERNIGDYNNNGEVEIADITPVGLYFGQLVAQAADPAALMLVDGDSNGEINAADLVPIGRNFSARIDGFNLYRTEPPVTGGAPLQVLDRADVYDQASPAERKHRLRFTADVSLEVGQNSFYVAAFSAIEDPPEIGLPSNSVELTGSELNLPPVWQTTTGVASATPAAQGIRLTFGKAVDPEGGAVTYVLTYSRGTEPIFGSTAETLTLPDPTGDPPYTYLFENDEHGTRFNFNLRARDPEGNSTSNSEAVSATVPSIALPDEPWPSRHGDAMRTGANVQSMFEEPRAIAWFLDLPDASTDDPVFSPVVSNIGWVGVFDGAGYFRRYATHGSFIAAHPTGDITMTSAPALYGDTLAVGTAAGVAVFDLTTLNPPQEYPNSAEVDAAPLLLGDYLFCCDSAGETFALLATTGEEIWRHTPESPAPYSLSPATDGQYLYTANDSGELFKLDLLTGEELASGNAGEALRGDAVVVSPSRSALYVSTFANMLVELSTDDLAVTRQWPYPIPDSQAEAAPCVIEYADPPLAVISYSRPIGPAAYGRLQAIDLDSGDVAWDSGLNAIERPAQVTATADRILAGRFIFDFRGSLRQALLPNPVSGAVQALYPGGFITMFDGVMMGWYLAEEDLPPQWDGDAGITALESGQYQVTAHWGHATNDHNMPVYYAVFITPNGPPQFDPPYTNTTVIPDIPPEGEGVLSGQDLHQYTADGLTNGTRYYVGVRAYERPWYDNPRFEDNVNYLGATPPWQREELVLGQDLPGDDKSGIYAMRGLVDPTGKMHLYFTDYVTAKSTHVWGTTADWQGENTDLMNYNTPFFALAWDTGLVVGWSYASQVGLLRRNDIDDWTQTVIPNTEATVNPQLSFAINGETKLAYTEHLFGTLPPDMASNYYYVETVSGEWQDPVVLDPIDVCGRDLQLVLGGPGADQPWIAYQRGETYAAGRFTPNQGQAMYARPDGVGGFNLETVDAGDNAPLSDCGKRMRQVLGSDGEPRLAYLDLNSSPDQATGQLKFARYDGASWHIETVHSFDLDFQPDGAQFTWGELSLVLRENDLPAIGFPARQTSSDIPGVSHLVFPEVWLNDGVDWRSERVWDAEWMLPRDREPFVLLETPDGVLHVFYAMSPVEGVNQPNVLVHMYRDPDDPKST